MFRWDRKEAQVMIALVRNDSHSLQLSMARVDVIPLVDAIRNRCSKSTDSTILAMVARSVLKSGGQKEPNSCLLQFKEGDESALFADGHNVTWTLDRESADYAVFHLLSSMANGFFSPSEFIYAKCMPRGSNDLIFCDFSEDGGGLMSTGEMARSNP